MMEVLVRNAHGNLPERERDYAAKKLGRLDRYFSNASRVEIVHREEKLLHRVEVTVFADGITVRGECEDSRLHNAIDAVVNKIEQRLRRLKSRIVDRHHKRGQKLPEIFTEIPDDEEEVKRVVVKERKHFLIKPMNIGEAALEMELLDHPFFVFKNEDSNQFEVLYKRKDGHYGLLMPE